MPASSVGEPVAESLAGVLDGQVRDYWSAQVDTAAVIAGLLLLWWLWRRRGGGGPSEFATDALYWLIAPAVRLLSRLTLVCLLVLPAAAVGLDLLPSWLHGYGPVARQPRLWMFLELVVLTDLASYWSHRVLHRVPCLWRFHAVHHSSKHVTWSSAARMHPVNDVVAYAINVLPVLALGFPAEMLTPLLPVIMWYAIYLHCPLDISHGVLAKVVTSPRFHRFHHTAKRDGGNSNFAGLFAFWDCLFGTYDMPCDRQPAHFGADAADVPARFIDQLRYPFQPSPVARDAAVSALAVPSDNPRMRSRSNAKR